jgi:ABC-type lipoprotein export system ATPase subunit
VADAIVARGLIQVYDTGEVGVPALRGLDLRVEDGEIAAVVGPSGSGKSTLLRLLAGLERPLAGTLAAFGRPLERASAGALARYRRDDVGIVDQHYWRAVSPHLPVAETVALPLAMRGVRRRDQRRRAGELLEALGLGDRGRARPAELSGGEQQRVAFAAAMANRPRLLLADEVTGELDARTAAEVLAILRDVVRDAGTTCVLVTHDELVETVADRVVHVQDGRAIAERTVGGLRRAVDATGWTAPELPERAAARTPPSRAVAGAAVLLDGVSRTYHGGRRPVVALEDVRASFASGGLHAVTGPSGSGKSTLLRLVAGLDRPDEGRVVTLGIDLGTLDRRALAAFRGERVGLVAQAPRLVPFLSAAENIELALTLRGLDPSSAAEQATEALAQVGLAGLGDRRPDRLSSGERTRVAIARALASEPALLLLDEPTAALDRRNAAMVAELLQALPPRRVTTIVATHDRDLIGAASDRFDLRDADVGGRSPGGAR